MTSPERFDTGTGNIIYYNRGNPKTVSNNEDSLAIFSINDEHHILVVGDGLGGHSGGGKASRHIMSTLEKSLNNINSEQDVSNALLHGLEKSNQKILDWGTGSGSTVIIAEVLNDRVRTYHAGDSECLLCGNHGKVILETISHSPVGYALEAGIIPREEALKHEDRHYVSNFIGSENMYTTISTYKKIKLRDTLILGSDGLFDNLSCSEIIEIIRKDEIEKAAEKLVGKVTERFDNTDGSGLSKPDDMSFILYRRSD